MMEMEASWASFNLMSLWTKAILMNGRGLIDWAYDRDGTQSPFKILLLLLLFLLSLLLLIQLSKSYYYYYYYYHYHYYY